VDGFRLAQTAKKSRRKKRKMHTPNVKEAIILIAKKAIQVFFEHLKTQ